MNVQRAIRCAAMLLALALSQGCASRAQARTAPWLDQYVGQVRELSTGRAGSFAPSIEAHDPILSEALRELAVLPGPVRHRRVAERYLQLKILDSAYDHFVRARQLDPTDAAAYDGMARIWRDWGFPHLGLADASRSIYYAPSWAPAHNTLGTVLAAMGRPKEARRAYERALALDPKAAYVLNNLCYLSFLESDTREAIAQCQTALAIDPALVSARNNLALAYAAAGRSDLARREFQASGDQAAALYNLGIVSLAHRNYGDASVAFEAARRQRPAWAAASARAREARAMMAREASAARADAAP
jgi:tetratricopeptide (TPR) repeat protein